MKRLNTGIAKLHHWSLLFIGISTYLSIPHLAAEGHAVITCDNGYAVDKDNQIKFKLPYFSIIDFDDVKDSNLVLSRFDGKYKISLGQVLVILELSKENIDRPLSETEQQVMIDALVGLRDAFALANEGKHQEAVKKGEEAATTLGILYFLDHTPSPYQVWFESHIAYFEYASGDLAAANKRLDHAESLLKKVKQKDPFQAADLYNVRGLVRLNEGKQEEAITLFRKAIATSEKTLGPFHIDRSSVLQNISIAQQELGQIDEALESHFEAMKLIISILPPAAVEIPIGYTRLGDLYLEAGKAEQAFKAQELALVTFKDHHGDKYLKEKANARLGFYDAMVTFKNYDLSKFALDFGMDDEVSKMTVTDAIPYKKQFLFRYGTLNYDQDKMEQALTYFEKAAQLYDPKNKESLDATILATIGHIHSYHSENSKAKKSYQQALQIYEQTDGEDSESAKEVRSWISEMD